jgi:hypothetical protein
LLLLCIGALAFWFKKRKGSLAAMIGSTQNVPYTIQEDLAEEDSASGSGSLLINETAEEELSTIGSDDNK